KLNKIIEEVQEETPGPRDGNLIFKIYYGTQSGRKPPTFQLFVNNPDLCKSNYKRFLVKKLLKETGLFGVPIKLIFRPRR
ncbi:MAG: hypothetical protein PHV06_09645, partial [bacterium]|nr:hypothetical protein [bacterium]